MTEKIDAKIGYFVAGVAIGSLIGIFFAPKPGEGMRDDLLQKVREGSKHARKKARELRERAEDLVERGKEMVNENREQIAAELDETDKADLPKKAKAKGV